MVLMQKRFAVLVLALTVQGCGGPDLSPKVETLTPDQARVALLDDLGVSVPQSYSLVQMRRTRPPGSGSPGYTGVYQSSSGGAAVNGLLIDGGTVDLKPVTCNQIGEPPVSTWKPLGFDCAMHDLRFVTMQPSKHPTFELAIATGQLTTGGSRMYVYCSGT
jgi:hypothetical protein